MEYKLEFKRGVDDLLCEYPWIGSSQGDTSVSTSIKDNHDWMIWTFGNVPKTQKDIDTEIKRRKQTNSNYIKFLESVGLYKSTYFVSTKLEKDPVFDDFQKREKVSESYRFDILDLSKIENPSK